MKLTEAAKFAHQKRQEGERENKQRKCEKLGNMLWSVLEEKLGKDNLEGVTILTEGREYPIAVVDGFPKDMWISLLSTGNNIYGLQLINSYSVGVPFNSLEELGNLLENWEV